MVSVPSTSLVPGTYTLEVIGYASFTSYQLTVSDFARCCPLLTFSSCFALPLLVPSSTAQGHRAAQSLGVLQVQTTYPALLVAQEVMLLQSIVDVSRGWT
jgi:hypothetical protein